MLVYLAARYSRRDELRLIRDELQRRGHVVTSRWLDTEWSEKPPKERQGLDHSSAAPPEYRQRHVIEDVEDVLTAACMISFTEQPRSDGRGGRHVEFGIALATGKRLVVVGPRENLFHYHPRVEHYDDVANMLRNVFDGEKYGGA